jgi:phosphoglucomutase
MVNHPLAGKPAPNELLIDPAQLEKDYYTIEPDPSEPGQKVSFGTSGHRGTPQSGGFNEAHLLAITQAICEHRQKEHISGPLYLGMDTHAVSLPAQRTTLEVLAANEVETILQQDLGFTPTPVISRAIISYNRDRNHGYADGIIITPSHNPPTDGGIKYNPPHGGPAEAGITSSIQARANEILENGCREVRRKPFEAALTSPCIHAEDLMTPYIAELGEVIDLEAIAEAKVKIGVDPLGGAAVHYWEPIAEHYGLDLTVTNASVDPRFSFMSVDRDGKIRMDCSSPFAMTPLVEMKDRFDIAFGNDPDTDRHGIVTPSVGLMNPNHYLSVAVRYLFAHRPKWSPKAAVGKTLVSSSMIDRVATMLDRKLVEVPVGFKWFVTGLQGGTLGFGGEESAGASFLRKDGSTWTTDKDGIILSLLAAEILARTERDPGKHYMELEEKFGKSYYARIDEPASPKEKAILKTLSPAAVTASRLAGEPVVRKLTRAPGNDAAIGGLKVTTENGWFAARPSGTENIYKIYAESFTSKEHLRKLLEEARQMVADALLTNED